MKKILIITDNIAIFDGIRDILSRKKYSQIDFHFYHSAVNNKNNHSFFGNYKKVIDVKKDLDWIINNFDLVISAHCSQIFPKKLINSVRCVNIHPGYNPENRSWYPQVFAIYYDLPVGITIHEMDEKIDKGPVIIRKKINKHLWDTSLSLYNRIIKGELKAFEKNVHKIIYRKYRARKISSKGNFFSKKDFLSLRRIDLNKKGRFIDFYNHLRALSHGNYKNAFFIDEDTGKKIFVKIVIGKEK